MNMAASAAACASASKSFRAVFMAAGAQPGPCVLSRRFFRRPSASPCATDLRIRCKYEMVMLRWADAGRTVLILRRRDCTRSWSQMLKVSKVTASNDYTLSVELSDGRSGTFDVKPYLEKGVFTQLKDQKYFKQFCGIVWPNEQDLSADTIAHELKQN
ncbi:MAG: DUF2442 domain-containing protein [Candidatus Electronema sp. VV]